MKDRAQNKIRQLFNRVITHSRYKLTHEELAKHLYPDVEDRELARTVREKFLTGMDDIKYEFSMPSAVRGRIVFKNGAQFEYALPRKVFHIINMPGFQEWQQNRLEIGRQWALVNRLVSDLMDGFVVTRELEQEVTSKIELALPLDKLFALWPTLARLSNVPLPETTRVKGMPYIPPSIVQACKEADVLIVKAMMLPEGDAERPEVYALMDDAWYEKTPWGTSFDIW